MKVFNVLLFLSFSILTNSAVAQQLAMNAQDPIYDTAYEEDNISEEILTAYEEDTQCLECLFPPEWLETPTDEAQVVLISASTAVKNKKTSKVGKAIRPVSNSKVLSVIGDKRSGGRRHQGVDYGAPMGSPIRAIWNGIVVKNGKNKLGGNVVKIKHPNGLTTYYAHLKGSGIVREGALVAQGQTIGYVGMSGDARGTTPHVHLEIRSGGKVLNPLSYIK